MNSNFTIDDQMAFNAMQEAIDEFDHRVHLEQKLFVQMNLTSSIRTPAKYHQKSTVSSPQFKNMTDSAVVAELSVLSLLKQGVSVDQLLSVNADALLKEWVHCSKENSPACLTTSRFRTIDGTCNNLENPLWGSALQPQRRSLPPVYDNKITSPRTLSVVRRKRLPTARHLSLSFSNASAWVTPQEKKLSMLFLTWGQFMDHDLVATAASKGSIFWQLMVIQRIFSSMVMLQVSTVARLRAVIRLMSTLNVSLSGSKEMTLSMQTRACAV